MFIIPKTQGQNGKNALHTTLIILGIFRADAAKKMHLLLHGKTPVQQNTKSR